MLHLETVEPRTLDLLKEVQRLDAMAGMRLVGGTALALLLGHRKSVDLDLFGAFAPDSSMRRRLVDAGHVADGSDSGAIQVLRVDGVKIDLVNYPYPWLDPENVVDGIRLASLRDIAAMKLSAAANRGRKKDFIDIARLLDEFSLADMFRFYKRKFSVSEVSFALRGLTYFDDAEADPMPEMLASPASWNEIKRKLVKAAHDFVFSGGNQI